jgi:3-isopropylmalate/(R)-2-methylmalate dehydratase small subunit
MARVWKFGDNVNTDQIIPARYYPTSDIKGLGKKCLCETRKDIAGKISDGDVILAGNNFGCGSSREYAAIALRESGARCVIAKSFARIFYRNAINIGFPILICEEAFDMLKDGDNVEVLLKSGLIKNLSTGEQANALVLPGFVLKIIDAGGIINLIKQKGVEAIKNGS